MISTDVLLMDNHNLNNLNHDLCFSISYRINRHSIFNLFRPQARRTLRYIPKKDIFIDKTYILTILGKSQFENTSPKTLDFPMLFGHFQN